MILYHNNDEEIDFNFWFVIVINFFSIEIFYSLFQILRSFATITYMTT